MNNGSLPSLFTSSSAAAAPERRSVAAGDVSEIGVSAAAPIYSLVRVGDLGPRLLASGIVSDADVAYVGGSPHSAAPGKLIIRTIAASDWASGAEFCGEILKQIAATGYPIYPANWLTCVITPQAPASPSWEIPGWVLALLVIGGLWLLWKNSRG